jgi:hypothetical protein
MAHELHPSYDAPSPIKSVEAKRMATCCPNRPAFAKGLCVKHYARQYRAQKRKLLALSTQSI